jgi:hypothetical protein
MLIMILSGPLELVSSVLEFTNGSSFRRHVERVWEHLKETTKINVNESCGTHIHLSPQSNSGIWTLGAVKAICRSIVYLSLLSRHFYHLIEDEISGPRAMYTTMTTSQTKSWGHASVSLTAVRPFPE